MRKAKDKQNLGAIMQDTPSPKKHTDKVSGGGFKLLSNIKVVPNYTGEML